MSQQTHTRTRAETATVVPDDGAEARISIRVHNLARRTSTVATYDVEIVHVWDELDEWSSEPRYEVHAYCSEEEYEGWPPLAYLDPDSGEWHTCEAGAGPHTEVVAVKVTSQYRACYYVTSDGQGETVLWRAGIVEDDPHPDGQP